MPPKIDTFQKQKILFKENLISLLKTDIFENGDHFLQNWKKNPSKLVFLQDFRFYKWSSHNEKINTSKTNCHFFSELTTKLTPFSKIAQFLQRIYTKCNVDFTWKMTLLPKVSLHKMTFRIKIKIIRQMKYFDEN